MGYLLSARVALVFGVVFLGIWLSTSLADDCGGPTDPLACSDLLTTVAPYGLAASVTLTFTLFIAGIVSTRTERRNPKPPR